MTRRSGDSEVEVDSDRIGFGEAIAELEAILRRIETDEIDLDALAGELRRATALIELCRGKVRRAETEVRQIVARLESAEDPAGPGGPGGAANGRG